MAYHSKGQKEIILEHLKENKSITSWMAIQDYGITRLSDVILRLRREGYNIATKMVSGKDRRGKDSTYAKYVYLEQVTMGSNYNLELV
tara:strand:- start:2341 stop:2604 length:264 start_codon:yes stop_codon:yes gene_type:complete